MTAVILEVIEQHFEEAGFLFANFLKEIDEDTPDRHYLASLNARLDPHLEGLVISAEAAWPMCEAALEEGDAENVFVAAYLAFKSGDLDRIKFVVETGGETEQGLIAVSYGLAWHPWELSGFWAEKFVQAQRNSIKSIGLFCFATYQQPLPVQPASILNDSLNQGEDHVVFSLMQTAIKTKDLSVLNTLKSDLSAFGERIQIEALKTRIVLGDMSAVELLKPFVLSPDLSRELREQAVILAFTYLGSDIAKQWMAELKAMPESERFMIIAVGAMNESSLLPWVVAQMETISLARIGGKVFSRMTGIDIREKGFVAEDETHDPEWLELDGDEELDWPDVEKIKAYGGY